MSLNTETTDTTLYHALHSISEAGRDEINSVDRTFSEIAKAAIKTGDQATVSFVNSRVEQERREAADVFLGTIVGELVADNQDLEAALYRMAENLMGIGLGEHSGLLENEELSTAVDSMLGPDGSPLSRRMTNALLRQSCRTVRDVVMLGEGAASDIRDFGDTSQRIVQDWLEAHGLKEEWQRSKGDPQMAAKLYKSLDDIPFRVTKMNGLIERFRYTFNCEVDYGVTVGRFADMSEDEWDRTLQMIISDDGSNEVNFVGPFTIYPRAGRYDVETVKKSFDNLRTHIHEFAQTFAKEKQT